MDISFGEPATVIEDAIQNGVGAISVSSSNVTVVELKKPLNSGDTAGKDIAWSSGNTYAILIMWNSQGMGSSGGNTTHFQPGGTKTAQTVLVSSSGISAFPSLALIAAVAIIVALVVVAVLAIKLRRRTLHGRASTLKSDSAHLRRERGLSLNVRN